MNQETVNNHKQRKKPKGWKRLRRSHGDTEMTKLYTEQEILSLSRDQSTGAGIIRPKTSDLHMPSDLVERRDGQKANTPPGVMLVIIALALIFIAIIAYFVAQMPPKN